MTAVSDSIRNIERIEETDSDRRLPRGVAFAFVVLLGACIAFAGLALSGRTSQVPEKRSDPLGDLLAEGARGGAPRGLSATDLSPKEVTFPQILSDRDHPSTALAAMRVVPSGVTSAPVALAQPPPATDRLPVVALPAQAILDATPMLAHPRDALTQAASDAAKADSSPAASAAAAGHEGGYQLQVSSFRVQTEAQRLAEKLREHGHKAYVVDADVPGRGKWFRVRVGPFATAHAAGEYRAEFEAREHVVPFVVTPEATSKPR